MARAAYELGCKDPTFTSPF